MFQKQKRNDGIEVSCYNVHKDKLEVAKGVKLKCVWNVMLMKIE